MSNWGTVVVGGEPMSAWDFRSIFQKFGTAYDRFYCPFCDIPLAGCLIDQKEISKSPYFSAKWGPHQSNCDGEPLLILAPDRKPAKAHFELSEMRFPEAFTDRPPPRVERQAMDEGNAKAPSSAMVDGRRKAAGSLGTAKPKTYLLGPIVEAYTIVISDGFRLVRDKKLQPELRSGWTKEILSGMPLTLDDKTTYQDAFRTPKLIRAKSPRIYHGKGTVATVGGAFVITSDQEGNDREHQAPFMVAVDLNLADKTSPKYHHHLVARLDGSAANQQPVRWFAYGLPTLVDGCFRIRLASLDYLYLKQG